MPAVLPKQSSTNPQLRSPGASAGVYGGIRAKHADESVTASRDGLNQVRAFRGVAQYFPKTVDGFFERQLVVDEGVVRPEALAEDLARDDFLRPFQQSLEDLKGLAG